MIPFLKVVNDAAVAVNQGGKRKGAVCSYLETWHLDIEEFLDLRKNTGDDRRRTHDMHGRAFAERYEHYEHLADEGELQLFRRLPAIDLWRKMLTRLFETGHPW